MVTPALALSSILSIALVSYLDGTLLHNFHASLLGITFGPIDSIFLGTGVLAMLGGGYAMFTLRGIHIADTEEQAQQEPEPGLIGK
ncbi:MAG: hypothetical protein H0W02_16225 [Ktedonobacteraceae bacterium]|nr:hypothetical protein [Ktedonobacteraceae bacterium]